MRIAAAVVVLAVAAAVFSGRRAFVRSWFRDGPPGAAPSLGASGRPPLLGAAPGPVRVVLVDGLSEAVARTLPHLAALCDRGIDLRIDVGFPTVSLPVQHVLWTGRTQQQSGVWYRIAPLDEPPAGALPARVPGSVAVAESHLGIAGSFGFSTVVPAGRDPPPEDWSRAAFERAAQEAFASAAPLVFVHVLRVDEAGHAQGRDGAAYREAARSADALVERLARAAPGARLFVLADHGHRPDGGHGGAEPSIRIVRGCIVGPSIRPRPARPDAAPVHLVDLSSALFRSAGLEPPAGSAGRTLPDAWADPAPGATLPRPAATRWAVAAAVVLAAAILAVRVAGPQALLPVWFLLAAAGFVVAYGPPSLSIPAVYPPLGRDAALATTPGLLVAAWAGLRAALVPGRGPVRAVASLLSIPLAVLAALLILAAGTPPLVPRITAWGSVAAVAVAYGAGAWATGFLLGGIVRLRRPPRAGTRSVTAAGPRSPRGGAGPGASDPP